jgi:farnesyl-diphosphate farnesyltransferase
MFLNSENPVDHEADNAWKLAMAQKSILDPEAFADFMLAKTSRTFALNIKVLPTGLRNQVRLAYLFCRMADTLEDDAELASTKKISLLQDFRGLFPPSQGWESRLGAFLASLPESWGISDKWDQRLVAHSSWIFPLLNKFSAPSINAVSICIQEMCDGMIRFTARQDRGHQGQGGAVLIETLEDLDNYCYFVAGTVGNLLCELFTLHSQLISKKRARRLKSLSVSFGLGLQLTNILKDIHDDKLRNVSYIPQALLMQEHLSDQSFLAPEGHEGAKRIMTQLIRKTKSHLEDALTYTCLLPRLEPRLRLFCLWPLFMAAETVVLMAANLDRNQDEIKMKITRIQVKQIVRKTSLACWSNHWLRSMFQTTMDRLELALTKVESASQPLESLRLENQSIGAQS